MAKSFRVSFWNNQYKAPGDSKPDLTGTLQIPEAVIYELIQAIQAGQYVQVDQQGGRFIPLRVSAWRGMTAGGPVLSGEVRSLAEQAQFDAEKAQREAAQAQQPQGYAPPQPGYGYAPQQPQYAPQQPQQPQYAPPQPPPAAPPVQYAPQQPQQPQQPQAAPQPPAQGGWSSTPSI